MAEQIRWEERYQTGDTPWDTGQPSTELKRTLEQAAIQPGRAIELGCGTGTNAIWLAQHGFEVTAVDFSASALEEARRKANLAGVQIRFLEVDVLNPRSFAEQFPFFFDRGCYHVVRRVDVHKFLETLERITEPGALGLILTGNAKETHDPGPPVVSEEELLSELGRLFEIIRIREFRFDQADQVGIRFLGWSCLVRRPLHKT